MSGMWWDREGTGMRYKYQCKVPTCKATGWAGGYYEPDTNAGGINDNDPMEDACEHIKAGGDYSLIDQEEEDPYDLDDV